MPKKIEYKGNNVYVLRVTVGRNDRGNVQTKNQTVTAESMEDAEAQYNKFEALVKGCGNGAEFKPPETVADLVEFWFQNVMAIGKKKTTAATNRRISIRVVEALGHLNINKVTYLHLNRFTAQLQLERNRNKPDKFLSERTIRMHQDFLKDIFEYAVKVGLRKDNPTENMELIKKKRKKIVLPDDEFLQNYFVEVDKKPLNIKCAIYLALFLGLRRAEICGLRWQDVDLENGFLTIHHNRVKLDKVADVIPGKDIVICSSVLTDPKTDEGVRPIAMPDELVSELKLLKQQNESNLPVYRSFPDYQSIFSEFLILNESTGKPINVDTLSHATSKISKLCGEEGFTTHKLRHLMTSVLIDSKVSVKTVQSILGHADSETTLDTYAHILKPVNREAAEVMNNFVKSLRK